MLYYIGTLRSFNYVACVTEHIDFYLIVDRNDVKYTKKYLK